MRFDDCLYFTANSLARILSRMADEEFNLVGIAPSYAFLLLAVNESPGMTQKALSERLRLAPSTVTRFVDALARRGYVQKEPSGRTSCIYPTAAGRQQEQAIRDAWLALQRRYDSILGREYGAKLAEMLGETSLKLRR